MYERDRYIERKIFKGFYLNLLKFTIILIVGNQIY